MAMQRVVPTGRKSAHHPQLERLEQRNLLFATPFSFADFSSTAHLISNGFGGAAVTAANRLRLTDGAAQEARSVFFDARVPIGEFFSSFSFRSNASASSGDGLTF